MSSKELVLILTIPIYLYLAFMAIALASKLYDLGRLSSRGKSLLLYISIIAPPLGYAIVYILYKKRM